MAHSGKYLRHLSQQVLCPFTTHMALAVCTLHNFLVSCRGQRYIYFGSVDTEDTDGTFIPGEWCQD
ncbi:hypothetical protein PR048_012972 [Dryococelus australis]|uniref:Uncharacterized protein n=1 Tax=Dryococelus australis TaxID=614101 RepID=A0ABQ9HR56_9NEOP|nr:hypothetical protein PR048_012972 [Dryococelus australis]